MRKIVCLDLDHTLFNYQKFIDRALYAALKKFDIGYNQDKKIIYAHKTKSLNRILYYLGYPNLRHYWNLEEYYIFIAIFFSKNKNHIHKINSFGLDREKIFSFLYSEQQKIDKIKDSFYRDYIIEKTIQQIKAKSQIIRLDNLITEFKDNSSEFKFIKNEFNKNYYISPRKYVVEFLNYLEQESIEFVLVSEGIEKVQIDKLRRMDLYSLFENRVLTTDAATHPQGIDELETYWKKIAKKEFTKLTEYDNTCIFFRSIIKSYELKENKNYYRRILHTIKSNNSNLTEALKNLAFLTKKEWEKSVALKLVMIGDRYDKDIRPLNEILGSENVKTIRIRFGKYEAQDPYYSIPRHLRPTKTFKSFEQVINYFHNDNFWEDINCIKYISPYITKGIYKKFLKKGEKSDIDVIKKLVNQINF